VHAKEYEMVVKGNPVASEVNIIRKDRNALKLRYKIWRKGGRLEGKEWIKRGSNNLFPW